MTEPTQDPQIPDTVPVTDLDQFVRILTDWHQTKVKTLKHMLEIPQGTVFDFNEEKDLVLQGDLHKGFMIGLTVALSELGELPFVAETEDDETPTTANEPAATSAD
jgi:hypothetical protein